MGCLLQETRVVVLSKHYALLSPVCEALLSLLFPFHWQGMYLPILPYAMLEILDAPVPYIVGLHSRYLVDVPVERRPRGVVMVDLDRDEVHLGFSDDSALPRCIPAFPERHATKLKARLVESASSVYVLPNNQRSGCISCGSGKAVPQWERDAYAQTSVNEVPANSTVRRRDILPSTDKAYRDNELLVPLSGFLSEHGHLYQREASSDLKEKKGIFHFGRHLRKSSSFDSLPDAHESAQHFWYNILELSEVRGSSY
jgi:DENN (AEX-3) domain